MSSSDLGKEGRDSRSQFAEDASISPPPHLPSISSHLKSLKKPTKAAVEPELKAEEVVLEIKGTKLKTRGVPQELGVLPEELPEVHAECRPEDPSEEMEYSTEIEHQRSSIHKGGKMLRMRQNLDPRYSLQTLEFQQEVVERGKKIKYEMNKKLEALREKPIPVSPYREMQNMEEMFKKAMTDAIAKEEGLNIFGKKERPEMKGKGQGWAVAAQRHASAPCASCQPERQDFMQQSQQSREAGATRRHSQPQGPPQQQGRCYRGSFVEGKPVLEPRPPKTSKAPSLDTTSKTDLQ
uniref:Uncharacterized protein n=1 Tax=Molossus molossus TaxID=27622 RepID=A0A7J8DTR5_MOLMO|nr:hypothetical protein HJG59_009134 [Molossus molossus]